MNRLLPRLLLIAMLVVPLRTAEETVPPTAPVPDAPEAPPSDDKAKKADDKKVDKMALLNQTVDVSAAGIDKRLGPDWNDLRKQGAKDTAKTKKTGDKKV